jgi:hypothetical protein
MGAASRQPPRRPAGDVCDDDGRPDLVGPCPISVYQKPTVLTVLTRMPSRPIPNVLAPLEAGREEAALVP